MAQIAASVSTIRTALWHVRKGGFAQLREWRRRRSVPGYVSTSLARTSHVDGRLRVSFPEMEIPEFPPVFDDLHVATILDTFSHQAFSREFHAHPVRPESWEETLSAHPIQLLFVESAWHGNNDAWQYQLTGSKAPSEALCALVAHCRERGIPSVLWNKEDPPHFADFLPTAKIFDFVFTTDETLLPQYRHELGHNNVGVLPFAASTAIHSPMRPRHGFHERDVAFGGMYFAHKFPERREQMDVILGGALDASRYLPLGLEIFSRYLGGDERYQFPGDLGQRVVGSLTYPQMLTAYKSYKAFLNVNSVVSSPSMCARRIFEISASGTPVISTPSPAIGRFFTPGEVPVVNSREEAKNTVRAFVRSPELADRTVHLAQRRIWREHTYSHRVERVLEAVGLPTRTNVTVLPSVSAVVCTNRPHQLDHVLTQAGRQVQVDLQVVVAAHGFSPDEGALRARARELGVADLVIRSVEGSVPLGGVFNSGVAAADGVVVTKMDDDDYYGPHYLEDLLHAKRFSRASVVGKHAHYMFVAEANATLLRFPHAEQRFTHMVMGPTITANRDLFVEIPFDQLGRGEDSAFLRAVAAAGGSIYSADRFNFVQARGLHQGHTWGIDSMEALSTGDVAWFGLNLEHHFL